MDIKVDFIKAGKIAGFNEEQLEFLKEVITNIRVEISNTHLEILSSMRKLEEKR